MDDERKDVTEDAPGPTPEDIKTKPPGENKPDEGAVEDGEEKLGRVKPY